MLEQFMASQIILSMGFSSKIITYVLVNIMIGKKEGRKIFFFAVCFIILLITWF